MSTATCVPGVIPILPVGKNTGQQPDPHRNPLGVGDTGISPTAARRPVFYSEDMADVRPLKELLADLVGTAGTHAHDPAEYLADHGHDLPPDLAAEAVVNFADTASPEVAEHLAPFVTAHTAGVEPESDWFALLTTAPVEPADEDVEADVDDAAELDLDGDLDPDPGMDFGAGAVDALDLPPTSVDDIPTTQTPTDWAPDTPEPTLDSPTSEEPDALSFDDEDPDTDLDD